ncbi:hypothetical protein diail_1358 [Diaporthe ilicicola]|nr:hypothetical protein diail_1358 [Diaporthe ilicicola]
MAPQCGLICAGEALQQPQYSKLTTAELCVNVEYGQILGACVLQDCSVVDFLSFLNYTRTACGMPTVDNRREVTVVTLTLFALAAVFFLIRMVVKYLRYTPWGADDTLVTVAFVFLIPFTTIIQYITSQGLGLEIWVLHDYQITRFLRCLLTIQEFYLFIISIVKASILAFFLRIFPDQMFKKVVWATMIYDLLVGFLFMVLSLVQRQPTWLIWEGWKDKEQRGVVIELNSLGLGHGGMNVALDIWMLVLPFTQLYKLNHPWQKKLGIFAMFSVGIFLTVVAAIRIKSLVEFATSQNITDDARECVIWSCIEVCVGVAVACMPHARQLFREVTRSLRGHTSQQAASVERTGRWRRPRRMFRDDSEESGSAVASSGAGAAPTDKSWYSSTTHSAYTTTTCTSDRQHSSIASDTPTRIGSVAQILEEGASPHLKTPGDKPESQW